MRELRRVAWAVAAAVGFASPGLAQDSVPIPTTQVPAPDLGGSVTGFGGGQTAQQELGGTGLAQSEQAPELSLSRLGETTGTTTVISPSNPFGQFYGNPLYQGRAGATPTDAPGGFGQALYGNTTTTGGGGIGFAGTTGGRGATTTGFGTTGRAGTAGLTAGRGAGGFGTTGFGGTGGRGGAGGAALGGVVVPLPRTIAYPAQVKFAAPAAAPSRVATDLQGVISRTPMIANASGVQVLMDGRTAILRGTVQDADEARLVEGLARLTPGVGPIRNELTYPTP